MDRRTAGGGCRVGPETGGARGRAGLELPPIRKPRGQAEAAGRREPARGLRAEGPEGNRDGAEQLLLPRGDAGGGLPVGFRLVGDEHGAVGGAAPGRRIVWVERRVAAVQSDGGRGVRPGVRLGVPGGEPGRGAERAVQVQEELQLPGQPGPRGGVGAVQLPGGAAGAARLQRAAGELGGVRYRVLEQLLRHDVGAHSEHPGQARGGAGRAAVPGELPAGQPPEPEGAGRHLRAGGPLPGGRGHRGAGAAAGGAARPRRLRVHDDHEQLGRVAAGVAAAHGARLGAVPGARRALHAGRVPLRGERLPHQAAGGHGGAGRRHRAAAVRAGGRLHHLAEEGRDQQLRRRPLLQAVERGRPGAAGRAGRLSDAAHHGPGHPPGRPLHIRRPHRPRHQGRLRRPSQRRQRGVPGRAHRSGAAFRRDAGGPRRAHPHAVRVVCGLRGHRPVLRPQERQKGARQLLRQLVGGLAALRGHPRLRAGRVGLQLTARECAVHPSGRRQRQLRAPRHPAPALRGHRSSPRRFVPCVPVRAPPRDQARD